jgi:hypothetical protein
MAEAKKKTQTSRKGSSSAGNSAKSSSSRSSSTARKSSGSRKSSSSRKSSNGSPVEIAREAVQQLQGLTGRPIEAVLGIEKDGREWAVAVEVLELERVPNTTDILGQYEVRLDNKGEIVSVRRARRYLRSQSGEN